MISKQLSNKFKIASLLCAIMVVYRHSLNLQAFYEEGEYKLISTTIETGISKLTEIAVPFFFLLSGFFFFRNTYYKQAEYTQMIVKKSRTLLIPFLFWNLVGIIPLLINHKFIIESNIFQYIFTLFNSDWNGALWYVRDLMTYMLFIPVYGWIFVINKQWIYAITVIILFYYWIPVSTSWPSSEGLLFFFLGGIIQKHNTILYYKCSQKKIFLLLILWLISCFIYPHLWAIHKYNTLLGLFILWNSLNYLKESWKKWLLKLAPYSFFIYVTHLYLIKGLKVSIAKYFYGNEAIAIISYFILPIIVIFITIFLGKNWHKYAAKSFLFVTGGRG